jgi:hypothetical protein
MNKFSTFLHLNARDLFKSIQVVLVSTAIPAITVAIKEGGFPSFDDWKTIAMVSLGSWISYIAKNWLTNSEDEFMTGEPAKDGGE